MRETRPLTSLSPQTFSPLCTDRDLSLCFEMTVPRSAVFREDVFAPGTVRRAVRAVFRDCCSPTAAPGSAAQQMGTEVPSPAWRSFCPQSCVCRCVHLLLWTALGGLGALPAQVLTPGQTPGTAALFSSVTCREGIARVNADCMSIWVFMKRHS